METEKDETGTVRYPECEVTLNGVTAHSVAIFMKVYRELKKYLVDVEGMSPQDAEARALEFREEATSGDADHVMNTCFRWVTVL